MRRFIAPLAACFALGACAVNQPGTSPSAFDGTYQGSMTLTHSNNQGGSGGNGTACGSAGQKDGSLMVQNGNVIWVNGGGNVYAPVARDGSFAAQNGSTYFSGKITNRAMVARGNISGCHTIYDLQRQA